MVSPRRTSFVAVVALCCVVFLTVAPIATAAQESSADNRTATDSTGQPVSTCFTGAGHTFTIGSADGTHIWVRLHAAMLTDSGGSVGAELVGSTGGSSIIEIVAGFEYVGNGLLETLTSPADAFEIVHGFDFQLPMLENAMDSGIGTDGASGNEPNGSATARSADGGDGRESNADDGPFEMLRC